MRRLITLLTLLLALLPAVAQEYWRPSGELVAMAREEPVLTDYIKRFFEDSKQHNGRIFKLEEKTELRGEELHILHKIKWDERNYYTEGQTVYVERETSTPANWASQRKEQYSALELALNAKNEEPLVWYNQLYNPWMTWLFYITGFTLVDEWEFNKPKRMNGTIVTTPRDLADAAMKIHSLPDWSRESQIYLLSRSDSPRPQTTWRNKKNLQFTSRYSDVKSVNTKEIEVCAGVRERTVYDALTTGKDNAAVYIYADNPLIVIAARTLGLPLRIHLYDLTRFGTKTTLIFQPESL